MRHRLFWKILLGFWLTFCLMVEGLWLFATVYRKPPGPFDHLYADRAAPSQMAAAVQVLEREGEDGLRQLLASWPDYDRRGILVERLAAKGDDAAPPLIDEVESASPRLVRSADGTWIRLRRTMVVLPREERGDRHGWFRMPPPEVLVLGGVGGLLFSAGLAWYLTRPLRVLKDGFSRLSQGELSVRVSRDMGRRRDELTDLACDFDTMAGRLQQLVNVRDQLLHDVSHELRSPLARLHMAVGLARQNPSRLGGSLDRIEVEAGRLDDMVGELLTLSRVESGASPMDRYFDLGRLVRSVVADARFEAQSSGVEILVDLPADMMADEADEAADDWDENTLPTVMGSPELFRRALENIVRNALRFSFPGQIVILGGRADTEARYYALWVCDHGPGVAEADLPRIFEPFLRLGPAVHADHHGVGLGLAIAQRAIHAHRGTIAASNRPQGGLRVDIRVPFAPSRRPVTAVGVPERN